MRETTIWETAEGQFTHYFRGKIGERLSVQLALGLPDEESESEDGEARISGFYYYERHGKAIELKGRFIRDKGQEFHRLQFEEIGDGDKVTGKLELRWQDVGGIHVLGDWTSVDGGKRLPIKLELAATGRDLEAGSSRSSLEIHAPYFLGGAGVREAANRLMREWDEEGMRAYREVEAEALAELVDAAADDGSFLSSAAYSSSSAATPVYCGEDLISVASFEWSYMGGAHGNYWYAAANVGRERGGNVQEIELADLFLKGAPWEKLVGGKLQARLRKQGAIWGLAEKDHGPTPASEFSTFVLTPAGIAFAFAPYEVHGYAAGSFSVTIEWGEIAGIVDAERWPFLARWTAPATGARDQASAK